MRRLIAALVVAAIALAVAACGSSNKSSSSSSAASTAPAASGGAKPGAGKPAVTLGDKNFTEEYVLGQLCPRQHDWHQTGQSLLFLANHRCAECSKERARERRREQKEG